MKKIKVLLFLIFTLLLMGCSFKGDKKDNNEDNTLNMKIVKGQILTKDTALSKLQILNCGEYKYSALTRVFQINNNEVYYKSINDLYVGMDNAIFYLDDKDETKIALIIIDGNITYENIRVAIRKTIDDISNENTLYHDQITLIPSANSVIKTYDNTENYNINAKDSVNFSILNNQINVSVNNQLIFVTNKRVVFEQDENNVSKVTSIKRAYGEPSYEGNLEVSLYNNKLLLINSINIEKYLKKVVPSEMPASFHIEALKAQTVAARTYAISDLMKKTNESKGYHVDDSTSSQVYNNQKENTIINAAISATKGLAMLYDNKLVDAKYYSTSSGLTASAHEVWFDSENQIPIPYLTGVTLAKDQNNQLISINKQNEASMLDFFKTIKMNTPDINSNFHRWKVEFTLLEFLNTLNENLNNRYLASKTKILTYSNDAWVSKQIDKIDEIKSVYVDKRSESGIVNSIIIETTNAKYKIVSEYNIRFTIKPTYASSGINFAKNTDTYYTQNRKDFSILPSGFFAIEQQDNKIIFYGGGYGHGCGMSQYGANGLATTGKLYTEILTTYYSNIEIVNMSEKKANNKTPLELYKMIEDKL